MIAYNYKHLSGTADYVTTGSWSAKAFNEASKIFDLCKTAGLNLTPIGSAFPYRRDQEDSNIRIAPTYVSIEDLEKAMQIFVCCVKLADEEEKNLVS